MESERSEQRPNAGAAKPRKTGPLQRFSAGDLSVAGEVLKAATRYLVPEDMTQRQAFAAYMPELYVLRNKGCSFAQIASLLADCGFNLQPSTVRIYYSEMLADRLDECQRRMNEQILLMAEVRKETHAVDAVTISEKLLEINQNQQTLAAQKIEKLFGVRESEKPSPPPLAPARAKAESKLRNNPILDEEPGVPNLTAELQPSAESSTASSSSSASPPSGQANQIRALKCLPVRTGVKPLPKKPNVPDDVYHSGDLEHPAVPGLMLNLEQRLYGIALEYIDTETGETLFETMQEKRFRVFWQKPVAMSPSSTSDSFVKMDRGLFKKQ